MASTNGRKVLDLDAMEPERPVVKFDNAEVTMRVIEDFSVGRLAELNRLHQEMLAVQDHDVDAYFATMRKFLTWVLPDLTDEMFDRLTMHQQRQIVDFFLAELKEKAAAVDRRTSAISSRASRRRTAGVPRTG